MKRKKRYQTSWSFFFLVLISSTLSKCKFSAPFEQNTPKLAVPSIFTWVFFCVGYLSFPQKLFFDDYFYSILLLWTAPCNSSIKKWFPFDRVNYWTFDMNLFLVFVPVISIKSESFSSLNIFENTIQGDCYFLIHVYRFISSRHSVNIQNNFEHLKYDDEKKIWWNHPNTKGFQTFLVIEFIIRVVKSIRLCEVT